MTAEHRYLAKINMCGNVLQTNIDFFVESGGLKAGATPNMVADLTYLNAVLDEIGRK